LPTFRAQAAERRLIVLLPTWEEPVPQTAARNTSKNRALARLARADLALLKPHLAPVELPVSARLEMPNARIDSVYFIERGFASVVADGPGKRSIEVGIIGREGMTGLALVLGHDHSTHETYMQAAGSAQRISAARLRKAMDQSVRLHRSLLRCAHAFLIQTTQTAVANGRSKLEERLARWLLMAQDRIGGAEVPLTHRFLAVMLGVHRPFVTLTVQALEHKGLIRARRQVITIVDRYGLVEMSNGAYVPPD
jgi:CRP-like cAMP-binding protein